MTLRIIAGAFKGHLLKTPKGPSTRPTQGMLREAVFNICQNQIQGARFLDLFAGSGAMGFEALSRGASHVTLVENHRQAILCIQENIAALGVASRTTLLPLAAAAALKKLSSPFNLIYIDPPYDSPVQDLLIEILDRNLASPDAILFVEERYQPHKKPTPLESPRLVLKDSRRFGSAFLHQYQL
jgi:16S rRNA (guanine(966)-N(2))-methyltransferase RsmD